MSTHDALTYLPRSRVLEFPKRYAIYDSARPSEHLYLVLRGRVKVFTTAESGVQTLLRIISPEGFFGETALVPLNDSLRESAVALDSVHVMSWSADKLTETIEREPKLALALFQYFAECNLIHQERICAAASYKTGIRVAIALVQLAHSIGEPTGNGAIRMSGLTHHSIADYVGTTREIVTLEMNRLRRLGYLEYSRRYLDVHADALTASVREQGVTLEQHSRGARGAPGLQSVSLASSASGFSANL
jgi:CRP-like cAMP-binding protein